MRPCPAFGIDQAVAIKAGRGHAQRTEQVSFDQLLVADAANLRRHFARRVISDILIAPARPRRANAVERGQRPAQELGVLPLLQLVVEGVAIEAETVTEDIPDRRHHFITALKVKRWRDRRDRLVEAELSFLGQLGDHRRGDPFRYRRPAEYRLRRHLLARSLHRFAIAAEEGDAAVLDDPDGHPDHRAPFHQPL